MLLQLNIKNFALIENLSISFGKGFNVLSGETGAGKSILIDAINFVLGSKFNKELIRTGEKKTFVEAIFTIEDEKAKELLIKNGIEFDDLIIISRETFQSGKSIIKVNGKAVIISNLKEITSVLLDIHGQHENQNLLLADKHIYYLDEFAKEELFTPLEEYKMYYEKISNIRKTLAEISGGLGEREKLLDFLKFQIEEIENSNLKEEEEEDLKQKFSILSNSEKINNTLSKACFSLYEGDNGKLSINDSLNSVINDLEAIEQHVEKIKDVNNSLKEAFYIIENNSGTIRSLKDSIVYDEDELNYINSRIFEINSLKKKYGKTIKEVIEYKNNIKLKYEELLNAKDNIKSLKKEEEFYFSKLKKLGKTIHDIRCKTGEFLEKNIKKELDYIGLEKSVFKVKVDYTETMSSNGFDKVQFLISTNPGEPLKSMQKIVSGGELSRIMLALKTVFVDKDSIPSIIFDEIDTGISGRIANRVAEKMYSISKKHQVFCVTHLPQIACFSDTHYLVFKNIKDNMTFTQVKQIDLDEKKLEISKMIGGTEVTKLSLNHSEEMIKMADEKKLKL